MLPINEMQPNDFSSFVERYQLIYERDPNSKVFAPLAEAYRRMGLLEEAIDLAEHGVRNHPHFASGRVALGKCYFQKEDFLAAVEQLRQAVELAPENLLAHQLLGECFLKLKKPADALNAFKMVLFLNPNDPRAAATVRELEEKIYADSHEPWADEEFAMQKLHEVAKKTRELEDNHPAEVSGAQQPAVDETEFERELALLDARFDRGDWGAGKAQLDEMLGRYPGREELAERKRHLDELSQITYDDAELIKPLPPTSSEQKKVELLQQWLNRLEDVIEQRRGLT